MKVFIVTRTDPIGYDETDSYACVAENAEQARGFGLDCLGDQSPSVWETATVTEVDVSAPGIIHSSFNAG